jgi:hypothetical protein
MNVVDDLREVKVLDLEGREVQLGNLWEDKAIVLVFVRHYG